MGRDELSNMKVTSEAVAGERDRLLREVTILKKKRHKVRLAVPKYKYEYMDHLAFLWEPHLGFLPTVVAGEICSMPEDI